MPVAFDPRHCVGVTNLTGACKFDGLRPTKSNLLRTGVHSS